MFAFIESMMHFYHKSWTRAKQQSCFIWLLVKSEIGPTGTADAPDLEFCFGLSELTKTGSNLSIWLL